jgi:hypothetical protein
MSRTALFVASLVCIAVAATSPAWAKGKGNKHHGQPDPMSCPADVSLAVAAECPCNGTLAGDVMQPWRNHGQYVRCVVHMRNALRKAGCLTDDQKRTIARCAAHSACGKTDAPLVCCMTSMPPCSDPMPDGVAAGTCDGAPDQMCDVPEDCAVMSTVAMPDEAACMAAGGVVEGAGATCSVCTMQ